MDLGAGHGVVGQDRRRGLRHGRADLRQGGRNLQVATDDARHDALLHVRASGLERRHQPAGERLPNRKVVGASAELPQHHRERVEAEPFPAEFLRRCDGRQSGLGGSRPGAGVRALVEDVGKHARNLVIERLHRSTPPCGQTGPNKTGTCSSLAPRAFARMPSSQTSARSRGQPRAAHPARRGNHPRSGSAPARTRCRR